MRRLLAITFFAALSSEAFCQINTLEDLQGISRVAVMPDYQVSITYSDGVTTRKMGTLPEAFLKSWGIDKEKTQKERLVIAAKEMGATKPKNITEIIQSSLGVDEVTELQGIPEQVIGTLVAVGGMSSKGEFVKNAKGAKVGFISGNAIQLADVPFAVEWVGLITAKDGKVLICLYTNTFFAILGDTPDDFNVGATRFLQIISLDDRLPSPKFLLK